VSPDETQQLKLTIITMAEYYDKSVSDGALKMMAQDLADLPFDAVMKGFETYRKDAGNKFFPLPAQIRQIVQPPVSDTTTAEGLTQLIIEKIRRYNPNWSFFSQGKTRYGAYGLLSLEAAMKKELGELGYTVVLTYGGGWNSLCENYFDSKGTYFATHLRDHVAGVIARSKAGTLGQLPALPRPDNVTRISEGPRKLLSKENS
jgi:hypothetical protein